MKIFQATCYILIVQLGIGSSAIPQLENELDKELSTIPPPKTMEQELSNVLKLFPFTVRDAARDYIARLLRRIVVFPSQNPENLGLNPLPTTMPQLLTENLTLDLTKLGESKNKRKSLFRKARANMLGFQTVPLIPENVTTPKWIPGELVAHNIMKLQIQQIHESVFGPLKSVTFFPSTMSSLLVFQRRYHPERLAQILKYNLGVEAEPNGRIIGLH